MGSIVNQYTEQAADLTARIEVLETDWQALYELAKLMAKALGISEEAFEQEATEILEGDPSPDNHLAKKLHLNKKTD